MASASDATPLLSTGKTLEWKISIFQKEMYITNLEGAHFLYVILQITINRKILIKIIITATIVATL